MHRSHASSFEWYENEIYEQWHNSAMNKFASIENAVKGFMSYFYERYVWMDRNVARHFKNHFECIRDQQIISSVEYESTYILSFSQTTKLIYSDLDFVNKKRAKGHWGRVVMLAP